MISNYEMIHSYSRKGTPYDNAVIESFHSSLKREFVYRRKFKDFQETKTKLFEYIEGYYNRNRIHGSIGCKTPYQMHYFK
ncbi:MAG: transposase [Bacilli bacterium]|nr:transposase [Bacilli bacterium]MBN2877587.1 transposase [Bacilli bacterium]